MKITKIGVSFQDKENLEEFCKRNNFPMIPRTCKEFDVHTHVMKFFNRMEIEEKEKFLEKTKKFIVPCADEHKRPMTYSEDNFPMWRNQPGLCGFHNDGGRQQYEYANILFKFRDDDPLELAQKIFYFTGVTEKTKILKMADERYRYATGHYMLVDYKKEVRQPRYPIYIISRGRAWMKDGTSGTLSGLHIKHYIVVEPQEVEEYKRELGNEYCEIIPFDMNYLDTYYRGENFGNDDITGPGPKRNFVWDHSTKMGYKWHWVMDDNAYYMKARVWNFRYYGKCANYMCAIEDYVDMFENVGQAGMDYAFFYPDYIKDVPYIKNTRVYSFVLNRNDITDKQGNPYRWRLRYNEDTDLSLRILKDGWVTLDFRTQTWQKANTQTCRGGNMAEIYAREGTYAKSMILVHEHPDVARLVKKYDRWHHYVDYGVFKQDLKLKEEYKDGFKNLPLMNDYGTCLIDVGDCESPQKIGIDQIWKQAGDRIRGPQQYLLVDVDDRISDEELEKILLESFRPDRSPLVFTDIYKSNSINRVAKICRKHFVPCINFLYYYDSKTSELLFNDMIYLINDVTIITNKDTKLYKHKSLFNIEKEVIV